MAFDFSKLKEVNDLDFEQVAIWPKEIKTVVAIFCIVVVSAICYYAIISSKLPQLDSAKNKESELRNVFESKYRIAVNLNAYEEQLVRIEKDFSSMLKTLPTSNETPGLLDDITFVGTDAGLSFKLLNWQQEDPKEFYTELPIQLEVAGNYHEFGQFASNVANLPRIVTLHDFDIVNNRGELSLKMQARTYRSAGTDTKTDGEEK
ncbi:type 4a pilus biogenesis protein PilO [Glaciecola sp. MH2013]|uniref:type 4a pilus biogenesis protein PilO n=1 Tax=Glaciecola sp. MH2013 TaxID=2785524 RepID=UPI00189F28BD|nr:type 4a pilus biogenesis protein PilO [Glaciecola sp. MH2013]MBF7073775.1 type 4a pilus biogenesis protein PilO [Glaciecola sp. MH2013]